MDDCINYTGYLGQRNIGDDAIFVAVSELFSEFNLIEDRVSSECKISIVGGGTVLPNIFDYDSSYNLQRNELNYCIGVGVRSQSFTNAPSNIIDIRRWLGRRNTRISDLPLPIRVLARKFAKLSDHATVDGPYFSDQLYREIDNFGFDQIGVRGPDSKAQLEKFGIESTITGDSALILEPTEYLSEKSNKIVVCLRDSRPSSWQRKWTDRCGYQKHLVRLCKDLASEYQFIFLPFDPADVPLHVNMSNQVENADYIDCVTVPEIRKIIDICSSADVIIGEKLHANVLAACCFTPFVSLEYSPKCLDFAKSVGMEKFNVRIDKVDSENLKKLVQQSQAGHEVSNLEKNVTELRSSLEDFSQLIKEDIRDHGISVN